MKSKKIIGWALLTVGLIIIFYSLYSSYNIFTAKAAAPEIFKVVEKEEVLSQKGEVQDPQAQVEKMIEEQLRGMIPVETLPTLLNLISWSIFAAILIFAGAQITSLGIKLIKK